MLSNSPLQVDVELLRISDRPSKHTPIEHMDNFYKDFDQIKDEKYDGFIITGAPLGQVPFTEVKFWDDMKKILDWSMTNVTSVMFLCWAVQAAMHHLYGVEKRVLENKISGGLSAQTRGTPMHRSLEALTMYLMHLIHALLKCPEKHW